MTASGRRLAILLEALTILLIALMMASIGRAEDHVKIAVLEQRQDAIDRHLENTDETMGKLSAKIDAISGDLSYMHGEERVILAAIGLVSAITLKVVARKKP